MSSAAFFVWRFKGLEISIKFRFKVSYVFFLFSSFNTDVTENIFLIVRIYSDWKVNQMI